MGLRGATLDNVVYMAGQYFSTQINIQSTAVTGGDSAGCDQTIVLRYKMVSKMWEKVGNMTTPRSWHAVQTVRFSHYEDHCML